MTAVADSYTISTLSRTERPGHFLSFFSFLYLNGFFC